MAYMARMGLWGPSSAFPDFEAFLDSIHIPPPHTHTPSTAKTHQALQWLPAPQLAM
jgi:hypothetical protein